MTFMGALISEDGARGALYVGEGDECFKKLLGADFFPQQVKLISLNYSQHFNDLKT